jgi:hypothetical protein
MSTHLQEQVRSAFPEDDLQNETQRIDMDISDMGNEPALEKIFLEGDRIRDLEAAGPIAFYCHDFRSESVLLAAFRIPNYVGKPFAVWDR